MAQDMSEVQSNPDDPLGLTNTDAILIGSAAPGAVVVPAKAERKYQVRCARARLLLGGGEACARRAASSNAARRASVQPACSGGRPRGGAARRAAAAARPTAAAL